MLTYKPKLLIFTTCFLLLLLPLALCFCGFVLPPQYEESFMGELKYKCERLDETPGNRIVFVGGSGAAFGIDSALVEDYFPGCHAVNFGMYAALGTKAMLDLSVDSIHAGDIVILMPEQDPQTLSCYFNSEYMWQGVDGAFRLLGRIDAADRKSMIGQFPYFAARKCRYVLTGEALVPDDVYRRSSFNTYGDISSPACTANIMPEGYDPNTPVRFGTDVLSDEFAEYINDYVDTLTKRGATVWYLFCPMNEKAVTDASDIDSYYDYLQSRLHCPIIGNPHDSVMEPEWFYDTNFHLNNSGKIVYTRNLIRAVKAALGDTSPTQIALPPMPLPAQAAVFHGDNSDADCFTWIIQDDTAVLTGLTPTGSSREHLTIPAAIDGYPITVLPVSVFAGHTTLRSVTVQENIRSIDDYAFEGCTALQTIRLLHIEPQHCLVGQHLLDETDAAVVVDTDLQTTFCLNYFWSVYAERIHTEE